REKGAAAEVRRRAGRHLGEVKRELAVQLGQRAGPFVFRLGERQVDLGRGGRGAQSRWRCAVRRSLAFRYRQEIGGDPLESFAARPAAGGLAGLEQIAEGHEIAALAAAVLVTVPVLRVGTRLDRQGPVASLLAFSTGKEAARTDFLADLVQLGER